MILDPFYNFHWIVREEAARAAQPYLGFFDAFLKAHRVRGVLNLRGANPGQAWWRHEMKACERTGIVHRDARLSSRQLPTRTMLVDLLAAFDTLPRPFLMKCSGGQDRTSFAAALYLLHRKGWQSFDEAETQFAFWPYLHWPHGQQRWLKLFAPFARDQSQNLSLRDWLATSYSAPAFRDWLEARGAGRSFHALYDVPGSAVRAGE